MSGRYEVSLANRLGGEGDEWLFRVVGRKERLVWEVR